MSRFGNLGHRLYVGDISFDFVSRRKLWLAISGVILLLAVIGLTTRGLNLGIEFKGGEVYTITKPGVTVSQAQNAVDTLTDSSNTVVQSETGGINGHEITVQINSSAGVSVTKAAPRSGTPWGRTSRTSTPR
ncbi:hypothetical protein GXW82_19290 [Streptacidiphilus sp. 4-A2]|nr:hypothetical protein [Streptacidiphilus sp. 4-A2]